MASLFSKPKVPKITDPVPMTVEEDAVKARKRRVVKEMAGTGVASTILSTGGRETLGG